MLQRAVKDGFVARRGLVIITGRGRGSLQQTPILKPAMEWLGVK